MKTPADLCRRTIWSSISLEFIHLSEFDTMHYEYTTYIRKAQSTTQNQTMNDEGTKVKTAEHNEWLSLSLVYYSKSCIRQSIVLTRCCYSKI